MYTYSLIHHWFIYTFIIYQNKSIHEIFIIRNLWMIVAQNLMMRLMLMPGLIRRKMMIWKVEINMDGYDRKKVDIQTFKQINKEKVRLQSR